VKEHVHRLGGLMIAQGFQDDLGYGLFEAIKL